MVQKFKIVCFIVFLFYREPIYENAQHIIGHISLSKCVCTLLEEQVLEKAVSQTLYGDIKLKRVLGQLWIRLKEVKRSSYLIASATGAELSTSF